MLASSWMFGGYVALNITFCRPAFAGRYLMIFSSSCLHIASGHVSPILWKDTGIHQMGALARCAVCKPWGKGWCYVQQKLIGMSRPKGKEDNMNYPAASAFLGKEVMHKGDRSLT
jgi:hypothetical protein